MNFLGNLLWFVLGGFAMCAAWVVIGVLFAMTGVGIPFAIAAFRIAGFAAWPFGRELIDVEMINERRIAGTDLGNGLWILFAGFWLALGHAIAGVALCMTVIGLPLGLAHFKLSQACFAPLGKRIVTHETAAAARHWYRNAHMPQRFARQAAPLPAALPTRKFCHACGTSVTVSAPTCPICWAPQRAI